MSIWIEVLGWLNLIIYVAADEDVVSSNLYEDCFARRKSQSPVAVVSQLDDDRIGRLAVGIGSLQFDPDNWAGGLDTYNAGGD